MFQIKAVPAGCVWPIRHAVMYPNDPFDSIKLPDDANGTHLALYADNKIVSVVSLFCHSGELQFRKFATLTTEQGKGFGTALLRHVFDLAREQNIRRVWCNARQAAAPFYRRFGMVETDEGYEKGGIQYIIMEWINPVPANDSQAATGR